MKLYLIGDVDERYLIGSSHQNKWLRDVGRWNSVVVLGNLRLYDQGDDQAASIPDHCDYCGSGC